MRLARTGQLRGLEQECLPVLSQQLGPVVASLYRGETLGLLSLRQMTPRVWLLEGHRIKGEQSVTKAPFFHCHQRIYSRLISLLLS